MEADSIDHPDPVRREITGRFGYLPPFYAAALSDPGTLASLWHQAKSADLDGPLPPMWRHQLFAYLSRFSTTPYCLVAGSCHLAREGVAAADILTFLETPAADLAGAADPLAELAHLVEALADWPDPGTATYRMVFAASVLLFSGTGAAEPMASALGSALGSRRFNQLVHFLGYVRNAHQWAETHPEVAIEADEVLRGQSADLVAKEPALGVLFADYRLRVVGEQNAVDRRLTAAMWDLSRRNRVALASLAAMADRQKIAFDHAPIGIAVLDPDGKWLEVNDALCRITGYPRQQLLADSFHMITHPDDVQANVVALQRMAAGEFDSFELDKRYIHADGHLVWVRVCLALLVDESGRPQHFISQVQDISARKEMETQLLAERDFVTTVLDVAPTLVVVLDAEGRILRFNRACEEAFGYLAAEVCGRSYIDTFRRPKDAARASDAFDRRKRRGGRAQHESWVQTRGGDRRRIAWQTSVTPAETGEASCVIAIGTDVTEQRRAEARLVKLNNRFRSTFEHAPVGMAVLDVTGGMVGTPRQVNEALGRLTDRTLPDLVGTSFADNFHHDDRATVAEDLLGLAHGRTDSARAGRRLVRPDGQLRWVELTMSLVRGSSGEPLHVLAQAADITGRVDAEQRMTHLALHDPLTGLANRALLLDHIRQARQRTRRTGSIVGVLFCDLDRFKVINDSLGHEVGDRLLTIVARRMTGCLRGSDIAGRLGGDEFVVCLGDLGRDEPTARAEAERVAGRIAAALTPPAIIGGDVVSVSASIGIALGSAGGRSAETLVRDADIAMYAAKSAGRNGHVVFAESPPAGLGADDVPGQLS